MIKSTFIGHHISMSFTQLKWVHIFIVYKLIKLINNCLNKLDPKAHQTEVEKQAKLYLTEMSTVADRLIAKSQKSFLSARENSRVERNRIEEQPFNYKKLAVDATRVEKEYVKRAENSNTMLLGKNNDNIRIDTDENPSIIKVFHDTKDELWNRNYRVEFDARDALEIIS